MKINKKILNTITAGMVISAIVPSNLASANDKLNIIDTIDFTQVEKEVRAIDEAVHQNTNAKLGATWSTSHKSSSVARGAEGVKIGDKIYVVGGWNQNEMALNTLEVYDTVTDTWQTKAPMPTARRKHSVVEVGGEIYVIGGIDANNNITNKVEVYNPSTNTWREDTPMPNPRFDMTACKLDLENKDTIVLFGGRDSVNGVATSKKSTFFNTSTKYWGSGTNLQYEVAEATVAMHGNKMFIIGGEYFNATSAQFEQRDTVQVYTYGPSRVDIMAPMPTARKALQAVLVGDEIYALGGLSNSQSSTLQHDKVEKYDITNNKWTTVTSMPIARNSFVAEEINGTIYITHGTNGEFLSSVHSYGANSPVNPNPGSAEANLRVDMTYDNAISLSINTNRISFNGVTGIEDIVKNNAVQLTVSSSLPYDVNITLEDDIQNASGSNTIDNSILSVKSSTSSTYKTFGNSGQKVNILTGQSAGNNKTHNLDFKINGGTLAVSDDYYVNMKIEISQN